jgi:hypothetical protein
MPHNLVIDVLNKMAADKSEHGILGSR